MIGKRKVDINNEHSDFWVEDYNIAGGDRRLKSSTFNHLQAQVALKDTLEMDQVGVLLTGGMKVKND
jgi:hypothetical protein